MSFLGRVLKWWHTKFDIDLQLTEEDILFGVFVGSSHTLLLNQCMIVAKQMIYACRHRDILPSFELFWLKLKSIYVIEKQIGVQNRQLFKFERKWKNLHASLTYTLGNIIQNCMYDFRDISVHLLLIFFFLIS